MPHHDYYNPGPPPGRRKDDDEKPKNLWDPKWINLPWIAFVLIFVLLIVFLSSVAVPDVGNFVIDTIRYFQRLFHRARFIPINTEFVQLIIWAFFVGFVIYRIRCMNYNKNKKD